MVKDEQCRSTSQIRLYERLDEESWNRYVERSGEASPYHQAGWKNVIERSFGHHTYYLLSQDSQRTLVGILPLVQLKSLLFGNFMVSLPYLNYGGICADRPDVYHELLQEAIRIAHRQNAAHIELRETRSVHNGLAVKTSKVTMRLDLPDTADDLWKMFSHKLRSQIKRPQKAGITARIGRENELDAFYAVFSANMHRLGTPVYSKQFFMHILEEFPTSTWICSVYKDKIPVASGFLIGFKNTMEIPWASSLHRFNHHSPNMLLYWSALELACNKRFRVFDFGRSSPDEGTYRFKEQWGGKPSTLYWYYWTRNGRGLPELNPRNPKYKFAIKVWRKLPLSLTRLLGPSIVKKLP